MSGKILIIEDDKEISKLLSSFLNGNGYETETALEGNTASLLMHKEGFDLILMDLMLPYKSGEVLIKELRSFSDTPVIVLSAKSMIETRLEMLRLGADDYILKPFDLNEVLVRIEVVLRRSGTGNNKKEEGLSCGELRFFPSEHSVPFRAENIPLTSNVLSLLQLFLALPQKPFTNPILS